MSGHSHWATIKYKKGAADAKRGKLFSRLAKAITVSVKQKGKDLEMNPALRMAIEKAKGANMSRDTIEKAIKKGSGEIPGVTYTEAVYEGYCAGGVAIVIASQLPLLIRSSWL